MNTIKASEGRDYIPLRHLRAPFDRKRGISPAICLDCGKPIQEYCGPRPNYERSWIYWAIGAAVWGGFFLLALAREKEVMSDNTI